ncbi:glycosyltransferase family 4 protein [candidate division KSB1 bacterium]|nr:glycosyltransferase family 4 protein [candidate division KSB1 bacterium]
MMKILIYAHLFPPSKGGLQYANLEFAKGLQALGHAVEVIACHNRGIKKFIAELNFPVHVIPKWPWATMHSLSGKGLLNWFFVPWYYAAVSHQIKRFKPDVILVADETANCFWGIWAHKINVPYVSYCSVPSLKNFQEAIRKDFTERLGKLRMAIHRRLRDGLLRSYKNAKFILAVSHSTKRALSEVAPEVSSKISIVPCSVDEKFFSLPFDRPAAMSLRQRLGIANDQYVLLSVARLSEEKGLDDVLAALSGLDNTVLRGLKYVVVGKGEAESYLKQLTKNLNLDNHVVFAGEAPHLQLIHYYDLCDLFVLPSHRESFGRVFAEAAARAKPAIGVNEGGMADIIEDGETGFLVPKRDIKALQDKIMYFISHAEKQKKLGTRAREKAERRYHSRFIAQQLEDCLKKAA